MHKQRNVRLLCLTEVTQAMQRCLVSTFLLLLTQNDTAAILLNVHEIYG